MADIGCTGVLVSDTFCGPLAALPPAGALQALDALPNMAGGCAANVAIDLCRQGIAVDVVGCLGNDGAASVLRSALEGAGVGCAQLLMTDQYPTSQTVILLIEGEDRRYFHVFGANRAFSLAQLDREWLAALKVFYLGGLFALPGVDLDELTELLGFCRAHGVVTVVDVVVPQDFRDDPRLASWLPLVDWFVPNDDEARLFTGETEPLAQLRALQAVGGNNVIVTCGAAGAVAAAGKEVWRCGAFATALVDPSGAGDAFTAGVIAAVNHGSSLPDTLRFASALGASAARAVGTTAGVFTAAEAAQYLVENRLEVCRAD